MKPQPLAEMPAAPVKVQAEPVGRRRTGPPNLDGLETRVAAPMALLASQRDDGVDEGGVVTACGVQAQEIDGVEPAVTVNAVVV